MDEDESPLTVGESEEPTVGRNADTLAAVTIAGHTVSNLLTLGLALVLIVALAGVVYIAITPQQATDPYTEFYVLGADSNASNYPTELAVGETAPVTVGIVNHEHREVTYTLVVNARNRTLTRRTIAVANEERWEQPVTYSLEQPGRTAVHFLLFNRSQPSPGTAPYRTLRLGTNVSSAEQE